MKPAFFVKSFNTPTGSQIQSIWLNVPVLWPLNYCPGLIPSWDSQIIFRIQKWFSLMRTQSLIKSCLIILVYQLEDTFICSCEAKLRVGERSLVYYVLFIIFIFWFPELNQTCKLFIWRWDFFIALNYIDWDSIKCCFLIVKVRTV